MQSYTGPCSTSTDCGSSPAHHLHTKREIWICKWNFINGHYFCHIKAKFLLNNKGFFSKVSQVQTPDNNGHKIFQSFSEFFRYVCGNETLPVDILSKLKSPQSRSHAITSWVARVVCWNCATHRAMQSSWLVRTLLSPVEKKVMSSTRS